MIKNKVIRGFARKVLRRERRINKSFRINSTDFITTDKTYFRRKHYRNFQDEFRDFKNLLLEKSTTKENLTIYKYGDGDYFFLKGLPVGSAKPGNRALSRSLSDLELKKYQENSSKCDVYLCEIARNNRELFHESFPNVKANFPAEFVYGLLANKWLLQTFRGKIGLIGATEKLEIIKKLLTYKDYREYLGCENFTDYIAIPQKFACDDLDKSEEIIKSQLMNAKSSVFLVGMGHLKSGVLFNLPNYKSAIYIDVGAGIDALAGMIDTRRPYFRSWQNFRLPQDSDYSQVDYLQYNFDNQVQLGEIGGSK